MDVEGAGSVSAMAARRVKFEGASVERLRAINKSERHAFLRSPSDISIADSGLEFHAELLRIADNDVLTLQRKAISFLVADRLFSVVTEESRRTLVSDHADLLDAIAEGEVALARRLAESHAERTRELIASTNPSLLGQLIDWR
jgi:DNA-binding GntR family transcriptional regulator